MSLSPEQTKEALEGYDRWVKQQLAPELDGDRLSVQSYLEWYATERIKDEHEEIYAIAVSDAWDEDLGKDVRRILGIQQGKPRLVEAEE